MNKKTKKISVACMGSRERYGLPVALHECNLLNKLFTDIYLPSWVASMSSNPNLPGPLKALLSRNHTKLPFHKVNSQYLMGFDFRMKVRKARTLFEKQELLCEYGRVFSTEVSKKIKNEDIFLGFSGESLETFYYCKNIGIRVVLDQVDPGLYEWEVVAKEYSKYQDWESSDVDNRWSRNFEARVKSEIDLADEIIVNSQYSKDALSYWGVYKNITILPIASSVQRVPRVVVKKKSLRVLFIGLLSLRKGVHIALKAIDILVRRGFDVELILVGESIIKLDKMNEFKGWKYIGPLPGGDIPGVIDSCDVLLFPTYSDGFGMVQIEAISRGMPVISTKNAAQVIEHGVSGFLVEIGNVDAVVECIEQYCNDKDLLQMHSTSAYEKSEFFTSKKYAGLINEKFSSF